MLKTLRNRLILSHILPLIIVIPLLGIFLLYALEKQVFLPRLTRELESDALLLADVTLSQPDLWNQPAQAQAFLDSLHLDTPDVIALVRPDGTILASNAPKLAPPGSLAETPLMEQAATGQVASAMRYSRILQNDGLDVVAQVSTPGGPPLGYVQILYHISSLVDEFLQVRYLLAGILAGALIFGGLLGYSLAVSLSAPILEATRGVEQIAGGGLSEPLHVSGPKEIRTLLTTVNNLMTRLHELEEARRKLLANLVHEIGRPLGALRAAIQALRLGASRDPQLFEELLGGMDQESARLQRLLEELSTLHHLVLGPLELDKVDTPLSPWLNELLITWKQAALEKGLVWTQNIPTELPVLSIDPMKLGQAVGNLLSNAIKYTPVGGQVSVTAGCEAGSIWLQVADTGEGITPQELEQVFEPFYRSRAARRFPQGMGLGLGIALEIVHAHNGDLQVESQVGHGSTFTIRLPE